jgi:hypothetical protein
LTSSGSSEASAASAFEGEFSPVGSSADTAGSGSSTGSLNVAGTATIAPQQYGTGRASGGGTANTFAGGSAMGFIDLATAGGQGSGSATAGRINSGIDALEATSTTTVNGAATGTFTGNGSGNYKSIANQPYAGGSYVKGGGSGTGTALVGGEILSSESLIPIESDAAFNSNGGGSGFVESPFGGAVGNAACGASGTSAGNVVAYAFSLSGSLMFSGSSAANGIGEFVGGFSPLFSSGATGGQGSGNGSLDVVGAASDTFVGGDFVFTALGGGTAMSVRWWWSSLWIRQLG